MARTIHRMDSNRANIGRNRPNWFSPGEERDCLKSIRLEPVPRLQKSPWFLRTTVVAPRSKTFFWWNGGLAGTRTLDQPRKLSGLLYRNRLCINASASRGFFLRFISRSKACASSSVDSSTAAMISRLPPNRFVECVWPCRCSLSRRSRLFVDPM